MHIISCTLSGSLFRPDPGSDPTDPGTVVGVNAAYFSEKYYCTVSVFATLNWDGS